jgi:lipopolysaccharide transport system ATP-binding protein
MFKKKNDFEGMNETERIVDGNFWALRDINLEVKRGETLGIIGSNGAGKTTLLKIFSKILKQTHGTYTINGRVSSLIGVGTGFHQELTGRENVYFNGALLGMGRSEITKHFEEIVEFAEIGSFIDTPIKYYSSGMRSRLAFSVAMNLDAEIMIIDEALAVGDVAFKEKSIEKMRSTAFTGKSVLFVTHSLAFLQDVCDSSILIDKGRMVAEGKTEDVIDVYLNKGKVKVQTSWKNDGKTSDFGDEVVQGEAIQLHIDGKVNKKKTVAYDSKAEVSLKIRSTKKTNLYTVGYTLIDEGGRRVWRSNAQNVDLDKGSNLLVTSMPLDILKQGLYYVALDIEKRSEGIVVDAKKTDAKLVFNLSGDRSDILDVKKEGVIKPPSNWARV